jgi:glutamate:Na+ symporter, ESS family
MFALNSYQTLAVGILLYYLGKWLKSKIKFFQTYCIPNPVIGGVLFALINLALFEAGSGAIKLDTVQQSFFMNMFFTSVGFSASYALLKKGGRDVLFLTIICAVLITCQDIIGVALAKVTGLQPLLGLCAGSIPMVGGTVPPAPLVPCWKALALNGPPPWPLPWLPSA